MRRGTIRVLLGAAIAAALAGCGGGAGALAPLKDAPTTGPGTTAQSVTTPPPTGAEAQLDAVRARLERFLAVPDPVGFRLESGAEDRDSGNLVSGLDEQFAGKGFVHGMVQYWADGSGRRVDLALYLFATADGARQAWSCGCPGPPIAGIPSSSVVVWDDGTVSAEAAVNTYVVHAYSELPVGEGGTAIVQMLVREARARILSG